MFDILLVSKEFSWSQNLYPDKYWCNSIYSKISMKANDTKHSFCVSVRSMVPGHGITTPLSNNIKLNSAYYFLSLVHTGLDVSALFLSYTY